MWRRSWRGSAPSRLPARSWSPGGRSRGKAPEAAPGERRWSGWAEVGAGTGPPSPRPHGLEWLGSRESGWAGARSPIRAAGSVLRPGAAGGRGRWRGGRRAAAPPGRRASCRGPRGAGTLLGGAPSAGRGAPSWARRFLRDAGLQRRDAGSPLGRGWVSLPDLGVPLGRGSVCWKRGTL